MPVNALCRLFKMKSQLGALCVVKWGQFYEQSPRRYILITSSILEGFRHVSTIRWCSVTLDGWTSSASVSFLGITAHYITDDCEMKRVMIGCLPIVGITPLR